MISEYDRGRREVLNALLTLNPKAAAKLAELHGREPDPEGRLPFDVVFWVTEVADQLGIEPKDESDPFNPNDPGEYGDGATVRRGPDAD